MLDYTLETVSPKKNPSNPTDYGRVFVPNFDRSTLESFERASWQLVLPAPRSEVLPCFYVLGFRGAQASKV